MALGVIGIIVGLILMNYLVYKGLNAVVTAFLVSFLLIFTSGLPVQETWNGAMGEMGMLAAIYGPLFIFGSIMGIMYSNSGAAVSMMQLFMMPFKNAKNPAVKRMGSLLMFMLLRVIIGFSGLDSMAIMVTMVAITVALFEACDLPRRYVCCVLMIAGTIGMLVPAAPSVFNVLLVEFLPGYTASGAFVLRLVMLLVFIVGSVAILELFIRKDVANGIHFDPGPLELPDLENMKLPHWALTFIPIISVFVCYNALALEAWTSLLIGCLLSIALFFPYLPKDEGKSRLGSVVSTLDIGVNLAPVTLIFAMMPALILPQLPAFEVLTNFFVNLPIPAALGFLVLCIILVAAAADSALILMATVAVTTFMPAGLSAMGCGVIIIGASCVLDTLPNNFGLIMQCQLSGVSVKEAYAPIFQTTVVLTFAISILLAICAMVGIV